MKLLPLPAGMDLESGVFSWPDRPTTPANDRFETQVGTTPACAAFPLRIKAQRRLWLEGKGGSDEYPALQIHS
jgi:hypothetical protein